MTTAADIPIPLPSQTFDGKTVVASVWQNDDEEQGAVFALVLLLRDTPPHFEVCEIVHTAETGWRVNEGTVQRHYNIVPTVDDYKDRGGDY